MRNNLNLTNSEVLAYQWNNPARLRTGDAQGEKENKYIESVEFYRTLLDSELLPSTKIY